MLREAHRLRWAETKQRRLSGFSVIAQRRHQRAAPFEVQRKLHRGYGQTCRTLPFERNSDDFVVLRQDKVLHVLEWR